VSRDLHYGPDALQILDIFQPETAPSKPRNVLIFYHGGGWTSGDKHRPGDDVYDNVMYWAAQNDMVGVNVDYPLANYKTGENLWPSHEKNVAASVAWVREHIGQYGGDPTHIYLWGHSAGASMVASYATDPSFWPPSGSGIRGAFALSGATDLTLEPVIPYYGTTHEEFVQRSPLRTMLTSNTPLLLGYSADENSIATPHALRAYKVLCDAGRCPRWVVAHGSHGGEMQAVGTSDTVSTDAMLKLIHDTQ
jgi:triacylglycerol lipase